jgi:hypothetical protein
MLDTIMEAIVMDTPIYTPMRNRILTTIVTIITKRSVKTTSTITAIRMRTNLF